MQFNNKYALLDSPVEDDKEMKDDTDKEGEWTLREGKNREKKKQDIAEARKEAPCIFGFSCKSCGKTCNYSHSDKQWCYFKDNAKPRSQTKLKPCQITGCKYNWDFPF
jgi:hypothetical protein